MDLFDKVLKIVYWEGLESLVLTEDNCAEGCEEFLNFRTYPEFEITFVGDQVFFNGVEPLYLEDCPDCFLESIIINAPAG